MLSVIDVNKRPLTHHAMKKLNYKKLTKKGAATITDISYVSVIICFVVFLVNDLYGFIIWKRMKKIQQGSK